MYLFSKVAIALISPLGAALALALLALLLGAWHRRRWALSLGSAALVWLWLWSLPVASNWLLGQVEARYPVVPVQALPTAQAIVVLGGAMRAATLAQPLPGLSAAADPVPGVLGWLPDAGALDKSGRGLKELVGAWVRR